MDDEPHDSKWASRKFLLALLVVVIATGLVFVSKIDAANWAEVVIWVTGLYMAGNGASAAVAAFWGKR